MSRWPVLAVALVAANAGADPLRLRADALATTQSPAGLVMIEADGKASSTMSAEAVVWTAGDAVPGEHVGDVLVIALRARTLDGRASTQIGRFVATLGAIRPIHIDGAAGRVRLPHRFDVEAFAGSPVLAGLGTARTWDWAVGGRVSRRIGDYGSIGIAMFEQRDDGRLSSEEVGLDGGAALTKQDDVGARVAYDLVNPAFADVQVTASHRTKAYRADVYGGYRAASHLLPATSLFTVLGDIPAERGGGRVTWHAAPRLDLTGDAGVRRVDRDLAPAITARARLALDAIGRSALMGEVRRDGASDDAWTGLRGAARLALPCTMLEGAFVASTELELVIPDDSRGRGAAWPWALAALGWDRGDWHAAVAVEASASPQDRKRLDALLTLGRMWGYK